MDAFRKIRPDELFPSTSFEMLPQNSYQMWHAMTWHIALNGQAKESRLGEKEHYLGMYLYRQENTKLWTITSSAVLPRAKQTVENTATNMPGKLAKHMFCAMAEEYTRFHNFKHGTATQAVFPVELIKEINFFKRMGEEPCFAVSKQIIPPKYDPLDPNSEEAVDTYFKNLPVDRSGLLRDLDKLAEEDVIDNDGYTMLADLGRVTQLIIYQSPKPDNPHNRKVYKIDEKGEQELVATCSTFDNARDLTRIVETGYLALAYEADPRLRFTYGNNTMHFDNNWGVRPPGYGARSPDLN